MEYYQDLPKNEKVVQKGYSGGFDMKNVFIVVGLGFGDEGKGTIIDYLVRKHNVETVVRFNGGPQAAHYVITPNGVQHCFSQFCSGALAGALTYHTKFMFIEPYAFVEEANCLVDLGLHDPFFTVKIDPNCPVVTPYHKYIGQMIELSKGNLRHGSVGLGVGQVVSDVKAKGKDALVINDTLHFDVTLEKLKQIKEEIIIRAEWFFKNDLPESKKLKERLELIQKLDPKYLAADYNLFVTQNEIIASDNHLKLLMDFDSSLMFEGAQGSLIDIQDGFWPYVTKSNTTTKNADLLLRDFNINIQRIGILRAYDHRHGPGPFPTEDISLKKLLTETHNLQNVWQGSFRVGWFDIVMSKYAIEMNGFIDFIALTNLDKMSDLGEILICNQYEYIGSDVHILDEFFEWEYQNNNIYILRIKHKHRDIEDQSVLTRLLFECKPVFLSCVEGWMTDISGVTKYSDFPSRLHDYVNIIQRDLGVPIEIISKGDTWMDKIEV